MTYRLGLDFGTTFSAAAVNRAGDVRVSELGQRSAAVPSVLFVREDGTMLFGEDAYLRGGSEPDRLVRFLKRRLGEHNRVLVGGHNYSAEQLVGAYLRWAVDMVSASEGGPPAEIVLGHPATWRSYRLDAFREAAAAGGIRDAQYVPEPVAAAMHHTNEHRFGEGDLVGVYDLGGGTFDAAVLRRTGQSFVLAGEPEGEEHLGGVDFDEVITHLVQAKLGARWTEAVQAGGAGSAAALGRLARECTAGKEALSVDERVEIPVVLSGLNEVVEVTRRELEMHLDPSVMQSIGAFRRALAGAGTDAGQLSAVLLVGGSSAIPLVRQRLAEQVGQVPMLTSDPKHAVARGASVYVDRMAPSVPVPVTPAPVIPGPVAPVPAVPIDPPAPMPPAGASPPESSLPPTPEWATEPDPIPPEPVAGRSKLPLVLAAAVLVAVALSGAIFALSRIDRDSGTPLVDATQVAGETRSGGGEAAGSSIAAPLASPEGMAQIPAGTYTVGVGGGTVETAPERTVELDAFYLDQYEVTNAQYQQFVQAIGAPEPTSWPQSRMPEDLADHPVRGVEQVWADTFCQALSKRLPTEAEWEAGARGPEGALYPWGDDPSVVDLDGLGSQPVGEVAENVSSLDVFDTVGSAWEWVGEPYEPVAEGEVVRRGGEYGRVREGAAMRQPVAANNAGAVAETGFRCAAAEIDEATAFMEFTEGGVLPEEQAQVERAPLDDGVLVDEHFDQPSQFGFPEEDTAITRRGLHSPWYHVETSAPEIQSVALGGFNFADAVVEAPVFVDAVDLVNGGFRYGLVVRADGAQRSPRTGDGPLRPTNFHALVIDPLSERWELVHDDALPLRTVASGPIPGGVKGVDASSPDVLKIEMDGSILRMFINGESVGDYDTRGFHLAGDIGFFVESFDQSRAHVHFEGLKVTPLPGR